MSKCNNKKSNCKKENENKTVVDLAKTEDLGRKKMTDEEQEGYNFMGTLNNWTTPDEQETKVEEIEKATKVEVNHVKEAENNNHGQWTKK